MVHTLSWGIKLRAGLYQGSLVLKLLVSADSSGSLEHEIPRRTEPLYQHGTNPVRAPCKDISNALHMKDYSMVGRSNDRTLHAMHATERTTPR